MKKVIQTAQVFVILILCLSHAKGQSIPNIKQDSIVYYNDTVKIGATISYPVNVSNNQIAVVLVSGTGKQNRDGLMAGHKMFEVLADSLTQKGIVVLRSDDRGVGISTGDYDKATTGDFAKDAIAGMNYLYARKDLNIVKVGMIGHSEGGMAAAIAASANKRVSFVISLSSPGQTGLDALLLQNRVLVHSASISDINKIRFDSVNNLLFHVVYNNKQSDSLESEIRKAYAEWKIWDDSVVKANNLQYGGHFFFPLESYIRQAKMRWYQYFIHYNPAEVLPKIHVPYFAINGDKDLISDGKTNLEGIEKYLDASKNKNVKIWLVPGLNHLYQHCISCKADEYDKLPEAFAPEVVKAITRWILSLKM